MDEKRHSESKGSFSLASSAADSKHTTADCATPAGVVEADLTSSVQRTSKTVSLDGMKTARKNQDIRIIRRNSSVRYSVLNIPDIPGTPIAD